MLKFKIVKHLKKTPAHVISHAKVFLMFYLKVKGHAQVINKLNLGNILF